MAKKKKTRTAKAAPKRRSRAKKPAPEAVKQRHSEFEFEDRAVETALQTGEHGGLLRDYFGSESYLELRELAQKAASRSVRGGPKVLILPGIMGSKIGSRSKISSIFDDVYWFDPIDVAAGKLESLRLGRGAPRLTALGVILLAYLKLKLQLKIWGFDVEFHPFDWRQSIATSGAELAKRLQAAGKDRISLVCHSMGGLVARWALAQGAPCQRLVMLGTPNFGSFAPVMAFRATYPVVRKIAALDQRHSAEELAAKVFTSFPGLTQMLPSPEKFDAVDLYDLDQWPRGDLRPRAAILRGVQAIQKALAPADDRFVLIAGVNQRTATGVSRDNGEFVYDFTTAGDGTVPLELARLPEAKTYYVEESHGSLPNNRAVANAVRELLIQGATQQLPDSWSPPARRAAETRSDRDLRVDPYGDRRGGGLSQREIRLMLEEVASPEARDEPAPASATAPAALDLAEAGYRHEFERVVVGRRKQHRLDLRFAHGSITEVDARALAIGIFRDVAPGGAATAIDREVNGAVTELTQRRMFSSNVGEIFMLPTGRHRLAPEVVAFVGLGAFDRFNDEVLQIAAENVLRTFVNARVEEFATVLMGAGSGGSVTRSLRALLVGFLRGLKDADRDHQFRRVIICEWDGDRYEKLKAELYRLSSTALFEDVEITVDEVRLPEPRPFVDVRRKLLERTPTTYLIVRQERAQKSEIDIRSSVLTAGSKATVVTGVQTVRESKLKELLGQVADHDGADFSRIGQSLADLVLAEEVRGLIPAQKGSHLVVVHDAACSRIPWEVLAFPGADVWYPAAAEGLSHLYSADNLSVAKWLEERVQDSVFQVLLVVNPTGDLAGAVAEGKALRQLFQAIPGAQLDELRETQATRAALLAAFGSGKYDVVHYAGHAFFDESNPAGSGILCHRKVPLTGADLAGLGNLPTLVFFNACEAARVRKLEKVSSQNRARRVRKAVAGGVGLAEAFMRGGVANFVGTYWPVGDQPAAVFATAFYTELLQGATVNAAIQAARAKVRELDSKDWANYIHYGNPDFVVKETQG